MTLPFVEIRGAPRDTPGAPLSERPRPHRRHVGRAGSASHSRAADDTTGLSGRAHFGIMRTTHRDRDTVQPRVAPSDAPSSREDTHAARNDALKASNALRSSPKS
jgi:hypothetical protein